METRKTTWAVAKSSYKKTFELSLIAALLLLIGLLQALPKMHFGVTIGELDLSEFEVEDIPVTFQFRLPPPPPLPSVALPAETDALPEDAEVSVVDLDFAMLEAPPAPPTPDPYDEFVFIPHEVPPQPVAGYQAIQRRVKYPPLALKNQIEGNVILGVLVDEFGHADKITILKKSKHNVGFEAAAIRVVQKIRWKPALQRDKAVKVWVAMPIRFNIEEARHSWFF